MMRNILLCAFVFISLHHLIPAQEQEDPDTHQRHCDARACAGHPDTLSARQRPTRSVDRRASGSPPTGGADVAHPGRPRAAATARTYDTDATLLLALPKASARPNRPLSVLSGTPVVLNLP